MSELSARQRLDTPRSSRRLSFNVDPEAIGRFSESIARFLGTGRYLAWQTILVVVWIALNLFAVRWRWDPYPFILLNLAFSTQAAYAAPLILLAQNRQENRDRVSLEEDRRRAEQTKADTEFWPASSHRCGWRSVRSPPATTFAANSKRFANCWNRCRPTTAARSKGQSQEGPVGRRAPWRRGELVTKVTIGYH